MELLTTSKTFLVIGAMSGFIAVALGAFGAHALKQRLSPDLLSIFEVGVRYQMYHVFALLAVAHFMTIYPNSYMSFAGWMFTAGTIIFSGSLYILALTAVKAWGAVTPIGGLLLLAGWISMLIGALR